MGFIMRFLAENANFIGMIGVGFVLIAYALLQVNKMSPQSIIYSLLNTIGSLMILVSLYYYWNLASGVIEIAWLLISLYGLIRATRRYYA